MNRPNSVIAGEGQVQIRMIADALGVEVSEVRETVRPRHDSSMRSCCKTGPDAAQEVSRLRPGGQA